MTKVNIISRKLRRGKSRKLPKTCYHQAHGLSSPSASFCSTSAPRVNSLAKTNQHLSNTPTLPTRSLSCTSALSRSIYPTTWKSQMITLASGRVTNHILSCLFKSVVGALSFYQSLSLDNTESGQSTGVYDIQKDVSLN